jgi:hypothetical protein
MKQKYMIARSEDGKGIVIKEYAEIDKDLFSVLCEQIYDIKEIQAAGQKGKSKLLTLIRNRNFFPPIGAAGQIIESIENLLHSGSDETVEIEINDSENLSGKEVEMDVIEDMDDDGEQLDDLLDETVDVDVDVYDENMGIKEINSTLKVDDDEVIDDNVDI